MNDQDVTLYLILFQGVISSQKNAESNGSQVRINIFL